MLRKIKWFLLILAVSGVVIYSVLDLIEINKCTFCGDVIFGKPERIEDVKPVCDRCYLEIKDSNVR